MVVFFGIGVEECTSTSNENMIDADVEYHSSAQTGIICLFFPTAKAVEFTIAPNEIRGFELEKKHNNCEPVPA